VRKKNLLKCALILEANEPEQLSSFRLKLKFVSFGSFPLRIGVTLHFYKKAQVDFLRNRDQKSRSNKPGLHSHLGEVRLKGVTIFKRRQKIGSVPIKLISICRHGENKSNVHFTVITNLDSDSVTSFGSRFCRPFLCRLGGQLNKLLPQVEFFY
jgi:hypothetical protein